MTRRRAAVSAAICGVVLHAARAAADPAPVDQHPALDAAIDVPTHLQSASHVTTDGGSSLDLPPGYFISEPQWDDLDFRVRALQDDVVRLGAENKSLRESAGSGAPWWAIAAAVVVGAAGGAYAWERWVD